MKRIIKTLEELRATEGVVEKDGDFWFYVDNNLKSVFTDEMLRYCGRELNEDPNKDGVIIHKAWGFAPWMWKEVEEIETRKSADTSSGFLFDKIDRVIVADSGNLVLDHDPDSVICSNNPAEGLEFPCKMMAWCENEDVAIEREIHGYVSTILWSWIDSKGACWKNAKPIPKFKPRYVWVKFDGDPNFVLGQELLLDSYFIVGAAREFNSTDFEEIKDAEVK